MLDQSVSPSLAHRGCGHTGAQLVSLFFFSFKKSKVLIYTLVCTQEFPREPVSESLLLFVSEAGGRCRAQDAALELVSYL